jgi:hypothetical protein
MITKLNGCKYAEGKTKMFVSYADNTMSKRKLITWMGGNPPYKKRPFQNIIDRPPSSLNDVEKQIVALVDAGDHDLYRKAILAARDRVLRLFDQPWMLHNYNTNDLEGAIEYATSSRHSSAKVCTGLFKEESFIFGQILEIMGIARELTDGHFRAYEFAGAFSLSYLLSDSLEVFFKYIISRMSFEARFYHVYLSMGGHAITLIFDTDFGVIELFDSESSTGLDCKDKSGEILIPNDPWSNYQFTWLRKNLLRISDEVTNKRFHGLSLQPYCKLQDKGYKTCALWGLWYVTKRLAGIEPDDMAQLIKEYDHRAEIEYTLDMLPNLLLSPLKVHTELFKGIKTTSEWMYAMVAIVILNRGYFSAIVQSTSIFGYSERITNLSDKFQQTIERNRGIEERKMREISAIWPNYMSKVIKTLLLMPPEPPPRPSPFWGYAPNFSFGGNPVVNTPQPFSFGGNPVVNPPRPSPFGGFTPNSSFGGNPAVNTPQPFSFGGNPVVNPPRPSPFAGFGGEPVVNPPQPFSFGGPSSPIMEVNSLLSSSSFKALTTSASNTNSTVDSTLELNPIETPLEMPSAAQRKMLNAIRFPQPKIPPAKINFQQKHAECIIL